MNRHFALIVLVLWLPALPAAAIDPEDILGKEVEITLQESILLALGHNLNLEIARTEPAISEQVLRGTIGLYDPNFIASWAFQDSEEPTANAVQSFFGGGAGDPRVVGGGVIDTRVWNYNTGLVGILPLGLSYNSTFNLSRTESSSGFFQLDPEWRSDWTTEVTVPLLKNFIESPTDVLVKRSRIADRASLEDFERRLIDEVQRVDSKYWELAASIDELRVAEKSLATAEGLVEQTRVQYEVGVVSRVAVTQAVSGAADREARAISRRTRVQTVQDELLNLILAPDTARYGDTVVIPESPALVEYQVDDDVAVQLALETRTEIQLARTRLDDAQVQLAFAQNQVLPEFNIVGSYRLSGLSGDAKDGLQGIPDCTTPGSPPPPGCEIPGIPPGTPFSRTFSGNSGSSGAYEDYLSKDAQRSWGITAELSIPIPNTTARAEETQRRIEFRRAKTDLRRTEQDIILGTRFAARALRAAVSTIEARQRGQEAAAEALRAEEEKLRLGDSTPFDVLQFEEDLASAENGLIVALQVYRDAITALDKAQGVLLDRRGIQLDRELAR